MRQQPTTVHDTVTAVLRGAYAVRLGNCHFVRAMLLGKMDRANIRIVVGGDRVAVEITQYDLHRGRIVYR